MWSERVKRISARCKNLNIINRFLYGTHYRLTVFMPLNLPISDPKVTTTLVTLPHRRMYGGSAKPVVLYLPVGFSSSR